MSCRPGVAFVLVLVLVVSVLSASRAKAEAIRLTHSGFLVDNVDQSVTATSLPMVFKFYNVRNPGDATEELVWTSDTCDVEVKSGYYSTILGGACNGSVPLDDTMLPPVGSRFLEVTVGGMVLLPRMQLGTVPNAASANGALDADRLGGELPTFFAVATHTHTAAGTTDFAPAAIAAMGTKAPANALNHDRYSDAEAVSALTTTGLPWGSVSAKPLTFAPAAHQHLTADLTDTLAIAGGGTGLTTAPSAAGQYLRSSSEGQWSVGGIVAADVPGLAGKLDLAGGTLTGPLTLTPASGHALIATEGNVGLGTTTPDQKLQVVGGLRVGSGADYQDVVVETDAALTGNGAVMVRPRTVPGSGVSSQYFHIAESGNTTTGPGTRHHLVVDGNLGVGTTAPESRLHVNGIVSARGLRFANANLVTLADGATFAMQGEGYFFIYLNGNPSGIYASGIRAGNGPTVIFNQSGHFTVAANTAGKLNLYDGGIADNYALIVQNTTGASFPFRYLILGAIADP